MQKLWVLLFLFGTRQAWSSTTAFLHSVDPLAGNKQYVVELVPSVPAVDYEGGEQLEIYRDSKGVDYSCKLPAPVKETQTVQQPNLDDESAEELLETINGDCVQKVEGWWTFEVCIGKRVRQYHTTKGVLDEEYVMGHFNASEQNYNFQKGQQGGSWHAKHMYRDGEVCDLTGKAREVDVRFLCSQEVSHIMRIEEVVSCQYVIVIGTPAMCSKKLGIGNVQIKALLQKVLCSPHSRKAPGRLGVPSLATEWSKPSSADGRTPLQRALDKSKDREQGLQMAIAGAHDEL